MKRLNDQAGLLETESELLNTLFTDWQPRSFDLDEKDHEADLFAALRQVRFRWQNRARLVVPLFLHLK